MPKKNHGSNADYQRFARLMWQSHRLVRADAEALSPGCCLRVNAAMSGRSMGAVMLRTVIFASVLLASSLTALSKDEPPEWAYPVNPPDFKPAPDTGIPRAVPGSSAAYTLTQIRDLFSASDWPPRLRQA